ncbi:MAG: hypothetical protein VKQ33_08030, partial [Candidatus Sericytochromatia bacterium]|nr:hypothetical protein [Candidatus Sericytochromatia bacterium]
MTLLSEREAGPDGEPVVSLAATGRYLAGLPVLAELLREELAPRLTRTTTDGEFRALRREALSAVVSRHRDARAAYKVLHFSEDQVPCKVAACQEPIVGAYCEVVNPITRADLKLPARVAHNLMHHGDGVASEPLRNMGNSPYGEAPLVLDAAALRKVLTQLAVPAEVLSELEAWARAHPQPRSERVAFQPVAPSEREAALGIHPLHNVLAHLVEYGCADIHIKAGHPPCGVLRGQVTPFGDFGVLTPEATRHYVDTLMSEAQRRTFDQVREMDLAFPVPGVG